MCHPPTPPAIEPTTDCEEWQTTDDYGTAWRNPAFLPPLAPVDAPQAPGDPSARESASEAILSPEPTHAPALTRNGFTEALLRRDGGR